ncbi:MAG: nucleotidyl transferase AbiEii/AbiGii toxin family protein [Actinomycetota bacterium]
MLDLEQIQSYYPENLRSFKKNILREYLQYKILEIIYTSDYAKRLIFMGGTAIRILHANKRFSEDLDFDNKGLGKDGFEDLVNVIKKRMKLEGYNISTRNNYNNTFRSYIKFHDIMYEYSLTPHIKENIDLRLDAEPQEYDYTPEKTFLNKFDIFTQIFNIPVAILLSQKIFAIFNRKRAMGRDFFDVVFLMGKTKPDYGYLKNKLGIRDKRELKSRLLAFCENIDLKMLARDARPFLFEPEDSRKVRLFSDFINNVKL